MGLTRINTRNGGLLLEFNGRTVTFTPAQMDRMALNDGAVLKAAIETKLGTTFPFQVLFRQMASGFNEVIISRIGQPPPTRFMEDQPDYVPRRTRSRG